MNAPRYALLIAVISALAHSEAAMAAPLASGEGALRVCADPSNLPLSNDKGQGYENKLAESLGHDLGLKVEYTYFPQRMGFIRNTLRMKDQETQQFKCDLIMGVPDQYELTATTKPYLRSTYAMVFSDNPAFTGLKTPDDLLKLPPEKLAALRIGVFTKSPGADWLIKNKLMDHAAVYTHQNGDIDESPAKTIERDLAAKKIDAAIIWGPIAGMLVAQRTTAPTWHAVPFASDPEIKFIYAISMGVRQGDNAWKDTLDKWIAGHQQVIDSVLVSYRVPLVDASGHVSSIAKDGNL